MNSFLCVFVLAIASVSAYNKDGSNCNVLEALSCEPEAAKKCAEYVGKEMDTTIDLTSFNLDNMPTYDDKWAVPFFKCYMTEGGFINRYTKEVNFGHLQERIGVGSKLAEITSNCFIDLLPQGKIIELAHCFLNLAMKRC